MKVLRLQFHSFHRIHRYCWTGTWGNRMRSNCRLQSRMRSLDRCRRLLLPPHLNHLNPEMMRNWDKMRMKADSAVLADCIERVATPVVDYNLKAPEVDCNSAVVALEVRHNHLVPDFPQALWACSKSVLALGAQSMAGRNSVQSVSRLSSLLSTFCKTVVEDTAAENNSVVEEVADNWGLVSVVMGNNSEKAPEENNWVPALVASSLKPGVMAQGRPVGSSLVPELEAPAPDNSGQANLSRVANSS